MKLTARQQKIVVRYIPLVRRVMKDLRLFHQDDVYLAPDDLFQIGCLALIKSALYYGNKNAKVFRNLAYATIRNKLLDQCRFAQKRKSRMVSADAELSEDSHDTGFDCIADAAAQEAFGDAEMNSTIEKWRNQGSAKEKQAMEFIEYKMAGYTGREIGKLYGVSHTTVNTRISSFRAKISIDFPQMAEG